MSEPLKQSPTWRGKVDDYQETAMLVKDGHPPIRFTVAKGRMTIALHKAVNAMNNGVQAPFRGWKFRKVCDHGTQGVHRRLELTYPDGKILTLRTAQEVPTELIRDLRLLTGEPAKSTLRIRSDRTTLVLPEGLA